MPADTRLLLGKIVAAHGIRGLVKILVYAEDPCLLESPGIFTAPEGDATIRLKMKNSTGKYWLAEAEGVADRNAAEALRGTELWLPRGALAEIENDGEFYIADLVGLAVERESGAPAGTLVSVQNFGAGDLFEIKPPGEESFFIAFTSENVPVIDTEAGKIVITDSAYENR
jgi:16S rRNA processing protein RimM